MKQDVFNHIQRKLLLSYTCSLVLILTCTLGSLHLQQQQERKIYAERLNEQVQQQLNQAIQNTVESTKNLRDSIANNANLQRLWEKKQYAALTKASLFFLESSRQNHPITLINIYDLDGSSELATQTDDSVIKPPTPALNRVMKTQKTISDLELGSMEKLLLKVVFPWRIRDQLVGYMELGGSIDYLLDALAKDNQLELVLTIHQPDITTIEYTSSTEVGTLIKNKILSNPLPNNNIVTENGKYFLLSTFTIHNFDDQSTASLNYIVDYTTQTEANLRLQQTLLISTITFSIILIAFYFLYSKKMQSSLFAAFNELHTEKIKRESAENALIKDKNSLEDLLNQKNKNLEAIKERYQSLFDKSTDAQMILDNKTFADCNQAALDMFGYRTKEDLYNSQPSEISPEFQPDGDTSEEKADLMIGAAVQHGSNRFEWLHMKKTGETFPVEVLLTAIEYKGSQLVHAVCRDITDRKKAAKEIEHQAYYDHLTGLPNRKLLLDRLKQALVTSRRHHYYGALLFIDLDRFKSVNDSLGHSIGDKLLMESSKRITSCIWDEDTVSRFGGDEYIVLLRHLGNHKEPASLTAKKIATRIQDAFRMPFFIQDQELHISISIGVALFPLLEETPEDIIKYADTAMYSAKQNGRNQTAFYLSQMHEKVINRLTLEKDLRTAIRTNQLDLHYQPQIDKNGKIIAVEALLRWLHPEQGFINPELFVSIAEDTGLIHDIGIFVLHKSIADITAINDDNAMSIQLAVNISPHQFRKAEFVGLIKHFIDDYQLKKHFLTLEVTEGIAIDNLDAAIEKFQDLADVGVRLSLDDFGTGYSSLSHLKKLPMDELKVDKSFVFDIEEDAQAALLVQTIIKIAHQFDLEVVAEGVETKEQLDFLKNEKCNIYQGYFYSKPLPLASLKEFIANQREDNKLPH